MLGKTQHADLLVGMNGADRSRVQELTTTILAGIDRFHGEVKDHWRVVTRDARAADWRGHEPRPVLSVTSHPAIACVAAIWGP